jgi:hypothetical protein
MTSNSAGVHGSQELIDPGHRHLLQLSFTALAALEHR